MTSRPAVALAASLVVATVLLASAGGAQAATTVYDNGGPDGVIGSDLEDGVAGITAEDFRLTGAARLTGATVDLFAFFDEQVAGKQIAYDIYADAQNAPGQLLTSGVSVNLQQTDSGVRFSDRLTIFSVSFDFQTPFEAAADTTYWLGIHVNSPMSERIFWASTPANGTGLAEYTFAQFPDRPFTTNVSPIIEHAFSLQIGGGSSVPEPDTWALAIAGVGLAGAALRRRPGVEKLA